MKLTSRPLVFLSIILGILTLLSSCTKCIEGKGSTINEQRVVTENFTGLISDGDFDYEIYQDTTIASDSIVVNINSHREILPYIAVEVVSTSTESNLYVSMVNKSCMRHEEPVIITIRVPKFEYLEILGTTDHTNVYNVKGDEMVCILTGTASNMIKFQDLNCTYVEVEIAGDGEVELSGVADNTNLKLTGSGDIDALDLYAKRCDASISGSGVMNVRISKELDAVISGDGDIYYKAEAGSNLYLDVPGLGEFIPLK